jgi:hypothetical protein
MVRTPWALNGRLLIYAAAGVLSNVHRSHSLRPFASVDCTPAFIVPDINKAGCIGLTWAEMTDD